MYTNIDTVISLIIVYLIGLLCAALISYRIGWWVGEKSVHKQILKICNVCRSKDK